MINFEYFDSVLELAEPVCPGIKTRAQGHHLLIVMVKAPLQVIVDIACARREIRTHAGEDPLVNPHVDRRLEPLFFQRRNPWTDKMVRIGVVANTFAFGFL